MQIMLSTCKCRTVCYTGCYLMLTTGVEPVLTAKAVALPNTTSTLQPDANAAVGATTYAMLLHCAPMLQHVTMHMHDSQCNNAADAVFHDDCVHPG